MSWMIRRNFRSCAFAIALLVHVLSCSSVSVSNVVVGLAISVDWDCQGLIELRLIDGWMDGWMDGWIHLLRTMILPIAP